MLDKLKELITNYVEVDGSEITEASRFSEDLGFNSYDFMCMLGDLEDEFDVQIEPEKTENIKTVGEAVELLKAAIETK